MDNQRPKVIAVQDWIDDESGGHWSTRPPRRMSIPQFLFQVRMFVCLRIRAGFLYSVAQRILAALSQPAEQPIPIQETALGENCRTWPQACIDDMQLRLAGNVWADSFDR